MKDWIVFLDARVVDGMCWDVCYFVKNEDKYSLVLFGSTYGGWGFGPTVAGREISIDKLSDCSWSLSPKKCEEAIVACRKSMKSGKPPKGYIQIEGALAYSDFFGSVEGIPGKLGEAIRKIKKRT